MMVAPRPRILLLTEFYPTVPELCVFGAFQRLQRHIEALSRVGIVDAVFYWPEHSLSAEELRERGDTVKRLWKIEGRVAFVTAATGRRRLMEWPADGLWALRGAVGFYHTMATMRTCRQDQTAALRRHLEELQPDLIFAQRLGGMAPLLRAQAALPPMIVDIDDLEHVKLERLAQSTPGFARRVFLQAQARLARHALRRAGQQADCLLICSELDEKKLQAACPEAVTAVVPNTAHQYWPIPGSPKPVALFVGVGGYPPNREAILWLIGEIWPLVHTVLPEARLLIAGDGTQEIVGQPVPGVEPLGFVADLAPLYAQARIAVCPIRRGGGTRIKVIEAAMNARPVVSTTLGAEGLSLVPDSEILLEDTAEGFAQACIRLLRDPDLAAAIGAAARRHAEIGYAASGITERLAALCAGLINLPDRA